MTAPPHVPRRAEISQVGTSGGAGGAWQGTAMGSSRTNT
jgi:hypothetical protein